MEQTLTLDNWQKEILEAKGNICLRSGRQVGKSTVVSILAGDYAANNEKKLIMIIISITYRQYCRLLKLIHF